MKEDIITNNFIGDDGFGDIMFEGELETEMFRHQASIEEPLNKTNDISKLSTIDEPKAITDSTLERSRIGIVLVILRCIGIMFLFMKMLQDKNFSRCCYVVKVCHTFKKSPLF